MNTTCGYGQMTRAEYKAGAPKRPICTRPATQYTTRPGTEYDNWYCDEHAATAEPGTEIVDLEARSAAKAQAHGGGVMERECLIEGCGKPARKRGWCHGHYRRWQRHGDPRAGGVRFTGSVMDRLWARVNKTETCWLWTGATTSAGYGELVTGSGEAKRPAAVHRLVWEHHNGRPIPQGHVVMHSCDVKLCVRPEHLSVGTHSQNTRDWWARGRQ